MFALPTFLEPTNLLVQGLNALLRREDWARAHLVRHGGKRVRLVMKTLTITLQLENTGYVQRAESDAVADVTVTVLLEKFNLLRGLSPARGGRQPADAWAAGEQGPAMLADMIHLDGDAGLAKVVAELAAHLRWDVEDDLAHWTGDIFAARLMQGMHQLSTGLRDSVVRGAGNMAEYLSQERAILVSQPALENWRASVERAHTAVDRLQERTARLQARLVKWQAHDEPS
jgi:ubiquinone biosynthesis protein UbiJ